MGNPFTKITADKADIRYDVTKYRIYKKGELVDEVLNLENY
ncbi:hypothetical protein [Peptoniphilus raoultii]|nr:hypothetical protein [Peptoniphilus raoultii]